MSQVNSKIAGISSSFEIVLIFICHKVWIIIVLYNFVVKNSSGAVVWGQRKRRLPRFLNGPLFFINDVSIIIHTASCMSQYHALDI